MRPSTGRGPSSSFFWRRRLPPSGGALSAGGVAGVASGAVAGAGAGAWALAKNGKDNAPSKQHAPRRPIRRPRVSKVRESLINLSMRLTHYARLSGRARRSIMNPLTIVTEARGPGGEKVSRCYLLLKDAESPL